MKKEYDLKNMKSVPNPYFARLSREITLRVGLDALAWFDQLAEETGIDANTLIAVYLRECAIQRIRPLCAPPPRKRSHTKAA